MIGKRRLFFTGTILVTLALLAGFGLSWARGNVVRAPWVPNHGRDFDFGNPPCVPAETTERRTDRPWIRYLGVSGAYIEWGDVAVLTAPFFSRYSMRRVSFGDLEWDEGAIRRGLQGLDGGKVAAVLVGHTHYDHFGDLPPILRDFAPGAPLLVNTSGRNMIAGCEGVRNPIVDLEQQKGSWFRPTAPDGMPLPVRILPIRSGHAPASKFYHFAPGKVGQPWDGMHGKPIDAMKQGEVYAFLIDLLDETDAVAFRIHYQDSASSPPLGFPPEEVLAERDVDLAIVCLPSSWQAESYPEGLLRQTRARHTLVSHYEDFFRDASRPLRFAPLLTNRRADHFMERLAAEMSRPEHRVAGPVSPVCGPSGPAWTMPLPGEWLGF